MPARTRAQGKSTSTRVEAVGQIEGEIILPGPSQVDPRVPVAGRSGYVSDGHCTVQTGTQGLGQDARTDYGSPREVRSVNEHDHRR